MPSAISASSNENEQPITKLTRSSRQNSRMSVRLVDQLAVLPDPVARQIGADVEILAQCRHARIAGRRRAEQRAGLRIELAEAQEIGGQRLRQDGEIALHIARREARGRPAMRAGADRQPRRKAAAGLRSGVSS